MGRPDRSTARVRLFGREARRQGSFAMIQPHRGRSGTAALKKIEEAKDNRSRDATWQSKAYELAVGEIGYVLNMKASIVAACDWVPEKWNPTERQWETTDDERVLRVMTAFIGPQGGQTELKRRAALHLSIGGESMLLGTPSDSHSVETGILWEFLSTDELQIRPDGVFRLRDGGSMREQVSAQAYTARLWRAHPQYSDLADSEMRRSLELAQEVQLFGQQVEAVLRSRLASGVLYVPEEITFAGTDDPGAADGDDIDAFIEDLVEHMSTPVTDRSSAASLVPLVMRGPADMADKVVLIPLHRDMDTYAQEMRKEALGRLAQALDVPPEVMTGKAQLNHWSAWNLDVDLVTKHVTPSGQLLTDFVTFAYMRPMLEEYEEMGEEESLTFRLRFDPSPVMSRQDEAGAARALAAAGADVLSNEVLRRTNGFSETDKPDEDEVFQRQAWELIRTQPAMFAKALLPKIKGFEGIDPEQFAAEAATPAPGAPGAPAGPAVATQSPPDESLRPGAAELVARLSAAADGAVERAHERASARVLTKARKAPELRDRLALTERGHVLTTLRPAELRTLGVTAGSLTEGAWDGLAQRARCWIADQLKDQGVDALVADDRAALAASQMASNLDEWLLVNLHKPLQLGADGFVVPQGVVMAGLADLLHLSG